MDLKIVVTLTRQSKHKGAMNTFLDKACAILEDFEKEVAKVEKDSTDLHQMWLHGAIEFDERSELERWVYGEPLNTKVANSLAKDVYDAWRNWLRSAGPSKVFKIIDYDKKRKKLIERELKEASEAFYIDDDRFEIHRPLKNETLLDFIMRLAWLVENQGEGIEWDGEH